MKRLIFILACALPLVAVAQYLGGGLSAKGTAAIQGVPASGAGYSAVGAYFDGADKLSKSTAFTNYFSTNTFNLLLSFWLKLDSTQDGTNRYPIHWAGGHGYVLIQTTEVPRILWNDGAGAGVIWITGGLTDLTGDTNWHHYLLSLDTRSGATRAIYEDGVSKSVTWNTYVTNGLPDVVGGTSYIGGTGSSFFMGCISEFWLSNQEAEWFDITVQANREKFRTADGKPADLGADGSAPTGTKPVCYLKFIAGNEGVNSAGYGDFSITGALGPCNPQ